MNDDEFDQMLRERHESFVANLAAYAKPLPHRVPRVRRLPMFHVAMPARFAALLIIGAVGGWFGYHTPPPTADAPTADAPTAVAPPTAAVAPPTAGVGAPAAVGPPPTATVAPPAARPDMGLIEFPPNSAQLNPRIYDFLRSLAEKIRDLPNGRIILIGRTASIGHADSAIKLSEVRAAAVRDKLVEYGVSARSIWVEGVGYSEPLVPDVDQHGNLIPDAAQRNRSVEIILTQS